jgi:hypothetical protein
LWKLNFSKWPCQNATSPVRPSLLKQPPAARQYFAMIEKTTTAYQEHLKETLEDLAHRVATGELAEQEFLRIKAELLMQQESSAEITKDFV